MFLIRPSWTILRIEESLKKFIFKLNTILTDVEAGKIEQENVLRLAIGAHPSKITHTNVDNIEEKFNLNLQFSQ